MKSWFIAFGDFALMVFLVAIALGYLMLLQEMIKTG